MSEVASRLTQEFNTGYFWSGLVLRTYTKSWTSKNSGSMSTFQLVGMMDYTNGSYFKNNRKELFHCLLQALLISGVRPTVASVRSHYASYKSETWAVPVEESLWTTCPWPWVVSWIKMPENLSSSIAHLSAKMRGMSEPISPSFLHMLASLLCFWV